LIHMTWTGISIHDIPHVGNDVVMTVYRQ
jgi:hypothetical protein